MSRTTTNNNSSKVKSPVKYWLNFGGADGKITYWDKELGENVELESVDLVLLDMRGSVGGWSEENSTRIYSNFVKSSNTEALTVMAGNKKLAEGLYADIKQGLTALGGHYVQNLFAMANLGGEWSIVCFSFSRSSLGAYSNFSSEHSLKDLYGNALCVSKGSQNKKGAVKFFVPKFELKPLEDGVADLADEKDKVLQAYFRGESVEVAEVSTEKELQGAF